MILLDHYLQNFLKRLANKFKDKKTRIITTTMSLMVKDKQLFKNYNKIWEKTKSLMRKKFDSKPFYANDDNSKYIKTKVKTFNDSIITHFHNKKVPKEKIPHTCLSIIVLDSVIKTDNNKYYPQTFLEECVYKQQKQQKQKNYITEEELKSDSDSNNESESESKSDSDSNDGESKSDIDNNE